MAFETFYLKEDAPNQLIVLTIEYTYHGAAETDFSPESVVLVYTGSEGLTGWARTPVLYRGEHSASVVSFGDSTLTIYVQPGITRVERWVYEFPKEYTSFCLLFPETEAIVINVG